MKNINIIRRIILITLCIVILWGVPFGIDYWRTTYSFEKPLFARISNNEDFDDGGSGIYNGIGYSIEIMGRFLPEEELKGVTHARFLLFGKEIKYAVRD